MPLDHYVSQVHLRNFYSTTGRLNAIRKSDLKCFSSRSEDVRRIEDNGTNAYLREDRAVEEFLKDVAVSAELRARTRERGPLTDQWRLYIRHRGRPESCQKRTPSGP